MKSTKRHFTLEAGEYLITPEHPDGQYYKITFKGEPVDFVQGLIILDLKSVKK